MDQAGNEEQQRYIQQLESYRETQHKTRHEVSYFTLHLALYNRMLVNESVLSRPSLRLYNARFKGVLSNFQ